MKIKITLFIFLLLLVASKATSQETVFALLKNDLRLADKYFENKDYQNALKLYKTVAKRRPSKDIEIKIARSHHRLKQYDKAIAAYEKHIKSNSLSTPDLYYYAEAQSGTLNYDKAVESYQAYLIRIPDDQLIMKKIWRLNNLQFLYEDSAHYAVRPVQFNTGYGELCAVPYRNGVVFISNRKEVQAIETNDASMHAPFYKTYFSALVMDSTLSETFQYAKPLAFNKELTSKFHAGPLAFYDHETKMVFSSAADKASRKGERTMHLYFAELKDGHWTITSAFPYNSEDYSVSNPTINKDGTILYFTSDMKGGLGGKDLYKSENINGKWTKPKNLGEGINTLHDEEFPFLHDHTLYFSSNGHPGLGGLDIFKSEISNSTFLEVENVGYPLNTNFDDFGIVIDSLNTHGYFSSNRKEGGYNDDVYEFDMDLQTYPLEINGVMKFKEHSWMDSVDLKLMSNAKIYLIDNVRNITVQEGTCDDSGNFSIIIPYHSQYKIRVVSEDKEENIVSLEIPKHRKANGRHEIVVVKDAFKSH
jgi:tetratricopeptide (TPR) repeat protein